MKNLLLVGPWGGPVGKNWSFKATGKITKIIVSHGECIDTISFVSQDDDGNVFQSPKFGGPGGPLNDEVDIDIDVDELKCISGTFAWYESHSRLTVTSLAFSTEINNFGPFGKEKGTHFSLPVTKASFAGFFGRSTDHLHAIGVYLQPK